MDDASTITFVQKTSPRMCVCMHETAFVCYEFTLVFPLSAYRKFIQPHHDLYCNHVITIPCLTVAAYFFNLTTCTIRLLAFPGAEGIPLLITMYCRSQPIHWPSTSVPRVQLYSNDVVTNGLRRSSTYHDPHIFDTLCAFRPGLGTIVSTDELILM